MPRVFAHAHFGALDTFISLFWTMALFAADRALGARRPVVAMSGAGVLWGLAILTKIHAWFLIPVVVIWAFFRRGRAAAAQTVLAVGAWLVSGFVVFGLGWPWLWYDTLRRFLAYLGTGVERASIRVQYLGQVYADRDVPWHYPWFYFAVTVPVGLHLFGLIGLVRGVHNRRADAFPVLLAVSIALFLVVFSTRIPVYDGERLFLMVFPLWSVLIGLGFAAVWDHYKGRLPRAALATLLVSQAYGLVALHPFGLSYYNALVGGLPGADRLGLELTYWGDAVDSTLLARLVDDAPDGASVALVPTLYPKQGVVTTTRAMARRSLIPGDQESAPNARWILVSRRTAYWPPGFREQFERGRVVFQRSRQGVWLSALVEATPQP
jgi:4-amino-4-deoxy-L-arabinose transferase-like glycosyltransferase